MSFRLADSDVVHESIFEAVVPSADLLADDPPDLGLNSWARPRFARSCVRLRQRSSNMPNQFSDCLRPAPQKTRPRNRCGPFRLTDLGADRLPDLWPLILVQYLFQGRIQDKRRRQRLQLGPESSPQP